MHRDYKKFNPGETPSWVRKEWQELYEVGAVKIKGEYALKIELFVDLDWGRTGEEGHKTDAHVSTTRGCLGC